MNADEGGGSHARSDRNGEWLVGRRCLSSESLALVFIDEDEREHSEEVIALEAA